jgi:hypothetical protein
VSGELQIPTVDFSNRGAPNAYCFAVLEFRVSSKQRSTTTQLKLAIASPAIEWSGELWTATL